MSYDSSDLSSVSPDSASISEETPRRSFVSAYHPRATKAQKNALLKARKRILPKVKVNKLSVEEKRALISDVQEKLIRCQKLKSHLLTKILKDDDDHHEDDEDETAKTVSSEDDTEIM